MLGVLKSGETVNLFRYQWNRDPYIAEQRRDLCEMYRKVRKDNPAMARLLHRRLKEASDKLAESLFGAQSVSQDGGLASLLAEDNTVPSRRGH